MTKLGRCSLCGDVKVLTTKKSTWCHTCQSKRRRELRAANKQKHLDYYRRYRIEHRERYIVTDGEYKRKHPRKRRYNPLKTRARHMVREAVLAGIVVRPRACQDCGRTDERLDAHHPDYSKPLDVMWLCRPCHGKQHWKVA